MPKIFPLHLAALLLPLLWAVALILTFSLPGAAERLPQWATPVAAVHVKNFYRIDEGIYRCSQPSPRAFAELQAMGIVEVINLRSQNDDTDEARGTSLCLHHIPMHAGRPRSEELLRVLCAIRDRCGPVAIHCWHGSDRTGLVTALYRMIWQGWTAPQAVEELRDGGYGYHPFYHEIIDYLSGPEPARLAGKLNINP